MFSIQKKRPRSRISSLSVIGIFESPAQTRNITLSDEIDRIASSCLMHASPRELRARRLFELSRPCLETSVRVVCECLPDFFLHVHDEGPVIQRRNVVNLSDCSVFEYHIIIMGNGMSLFEGRGATDSRREQRVE